MARPAQARAPATPTKMPATGSRAAGIGKSAATRSAAAAFSNHQGASRIGCGASPMRAIANSGARSSAMPTIIRDTVPMPNAWRAASASSTASADRPPSPTAPAISNSPPAAIAHRLAAMTYAASGRDASCSRAGSPPRPPACGAINAVQRPAISAAHQKGTSGAKGRLPAQSRRAAAVASPAHGYRQAPNRRVSTAKEGRHRTALHRPDEGPDAGKQGEVRRGRVNALGNERVASSGRGDQVHRRPAEPPHHPCDDRDHPASPRCRGCGHDHRDGRDKADPAQCLEREPEWQQNAGPTELPGQAKHQPGHQGPTGRRQPPASAVAGPRSGGAAAVPSPRPAAPPSLTAGPRRAPGSPLPRPGRPAGSHRAGAAVSRVPARNRPAGRLRVQPV